MICAWLSSRVNKYVHGMRVAGSSLLPHRCDTATFDDASILPLRVLRLA